MVLKEAQEQLVTIRDLVRWGTSRFREANLFFGHGTDNAMDEALALALHGLHLDHSLPESYLDARVTASERRTVLNLMERRIIERKPAPYLTRVAWFAGLDFYVDDRVLVPRSPIAELIHAGFQPWLGDTEPRAILDLCTGSGCIGIACALAFPGAQVDLGDVERGPLEVAARNVERHHLGERVEVVDSDLFESLGQRRYDLIVSNPPYVPRGDMRHLPEEYRAEPPLALEAGEDGLSLVLPMLRDAIDHLEPNGLLVVEVGVAQHALQDLLPEVPFLWLDFEHGGDGVFLLTAEQVERHQDDLRRAAAEHSEAA
ncbi:MAG: 50S ribosomal protein L3 N(5)-glutamine methyltransferase [Gammaproteobacteria bacterium]